MLKRTTSNGQPTVAHRVYTLRNGLARGLRCRGVVGFVPQSVGPAAEERLLESLALDGATVYDIGGDEGLFTLFFARRAGERGRVITFEPNPLKFQTIVDNVRLNGFKTVSLKQVALGPMPGRATLVVPGDETTPVSLDRSTADRRRVPRALTVNVEVDTVDRLVAAGLPQPHFVRIDVGGVERSVLEGMWGLLSSRHPRLYLATHGADETRQLANVTSVADLLWRAGYSLLHVESGIQLRTVEQLPLAVGGHLYCT
jgi:FkbM family methyltransferase